MKTLPGLNWEARIRTTFIQETETGILGFLSFSFTFAVCLS